MVAHAALESWLIDELRTYAGEMPWPFWDGVLLGLVVRTRQSGEWVDSVGHYRTRNPEFDEDGFHAD